MYGVYSDAFAAINEVSKDVYDTEANFHVALGLVSSILADGDISEIKDSIQGKSTPLRFSSGKVLNIDCPTIPGWLYISDPSSGLQKQISYADENYHLTKADNFNEDEVSVTMSDTLYDLTDAASQMANSIQSCELLNNMISTYNASGNRLFAYNSIVNSSMDSLTEDNQALHRSIVIGLNNIGSSPTGFLNLLRQMLDSVKNSFSGNNSNNTLSPNDTDYTIYPFAWSGMAQAIGALVGTILLLINNAVTRIIGILILAISSLVSWLKSKLDSLGDFTFTYDADNFEFNVPLVTVKNTWAWFETYLDQVFKYQYEEDEELHTFDESIYNSLLSFFTDQNDQRQSILLKAPFMDVFFWKADALGSNFYMEAYVNICGLKQMKTMNYDNFRQMTSTTVLSDLHDYFNQNDMSAEMDEIASYPNDSVNTFMKHTFCRFIQFLFGIGYFATKGGIVVPEDPSVSGILGDLYEMMDDFMDYFHQTSTPAYPSPGFMSLDNFVNQYIYGKLRPNPHVIFSYLNWFQKFLYTYDGWTEGVFTIIDNGIPTREFMVIAPKYGENARGALIAATIGLTVSAAVIFVGIKVGQFVVRRSLTNLYAQVQNKQAALSAADPKSTDYKVKSKDFRRSVFKYNILASIAGSAKLSKISGWEIGNDVPSALNTDLVDRLQQLASNYAQPAIISALGVQYGSDALSDMYRSQGDIQNTLNDQTNVKVDEVIDLIKG